MLLWRDMGRLAMRTKKVGDLPAAHFHILGCHVSYLITVFLPFTT